MNAIELAKTLGATSGYVSDKSVLVQTTILTIENLIAFYEAAKQQGRDELQKELSEQPAVWYMYRDCFGYWRNFNEAEASLMVKRGDRWAAFDKMIRRPLPPQTNKEG